MTGDRDGAETALHACELMGVSLVRGPPSMPPAACMQNAECRKRRLHCTRSSKQVI
jgi:hypothetical protein